MANMRNNNNSGGADAEVSGSGNFFGRSGTGGMMPGTPGTDDDGWEMARSRSMPRGNRQNPQPSGRVQSPVVMDKSLSVNSRLLRQGSGGILNGRPSALLQGHSAEPPKAVVPLSRQTVEKPQPPTQPQEAAPSIATSLNSEVLSRKTKSLLEEYFSVRLLDEGRHYNA